jgi:hypothetical protein
VAYFTENQQLKASGLRRALAGRNQAKLEPLRSSTAFSPFAMKASSVRKLDIALAPKAGSGPSVASMDGGSFGCDLIAQSASGQLLRCRWNLTSTNSPVPATTALY